MRVLSRIAGLALAAIMVVFALSNRETVVIGFWPLIDGVAAPVYLVMLLPFLCGVVAGWLAASWRGWRRRVGARKLETVRDAYHHGNRTPE